MIDMKQLQKIEYVESKNVEYFRVDEPIKICSVRFSERIFFSLKLLANKKGVSFNKYVNDKLEEILSEQNKK
jgi:predicted HicB family RNase H-like nuclease